MASEIVATVPLLTIDYLPLEGELQAFFRPSAKQKIQLVNQQGRTILCRVNARVTLLKGTGLANFLAVMPSRRLAFVPLRNGVVLVCPAAARQSPSRSTSAVTGEHTGHTPMEEPAKETTNAANPRSTRQTTGKTPITAGNQVKAGTTTPIEPPTPGRKKTDPQPGARAVTAPPAQLAFFTDANTTGTPATRQQYKPEATASVRPGRTTPSSAAGPTGPRQQKPSRQLARIIKATLSQANLPPQSQQRKTGAQKKQKKAPAAAPVVPATPALPAAEAKDPPAAVPLVIHFDPGEDQPIIAAMARGQVTPAADLFLHRQALLLSLSSGFDSLLSLAAVHDVQPLDYQLATVRHVLKNMRGRALLCDEVGMGKTIEAGLILMEYLLRGLVRRVLILTPPSLVEQWQQEMQVKFNLDFISYDAPAFKAADQSLAGVFPDHCLRGYGQATAPPGAGPGQ